MDPVSQVIEKVVRDLQSICEELLIIAHLTGKNEDSFFALTQRIGSNITALLKLIEKPKVKRYTGPFAWILNRF